MRYLFPIVLLFLVSWVQIDSVSAQWQAASVPPPKATLLAAQGRTLFSAYDGILNGNLYRSDDSGTTWYPSDSGLYTFAVSALYADDTIMLAGTNDGIYRSTNSGRSWLPWDSVIFYSVLNTFVASNGYFLAGAEVTNTPAILRSSDAGYHWSTILLPHTSASVGTILVTDSCLVASISNNDSLWKSTDDGQTWAKIQNGPESEVCLYLHDGLLFAIVPTGSTQGPSVLYTTYRSSDAGNRWDTVMSEISDTLGGTLRMTSDAKNIFLSVSGVTSDYVHSGIFWSTDEGVSWQSITDTLRHDDITSILVADGYLIVASDNDQYIYRRPLSDFAGVSATNRATGFSLEQNFPNPCNSSTTFGYSIAESSDVSVVIYDEIGRSVQHFDSKMVAPGRHRIQWNPSELPDGVYTYRLTAGEFSQSRRLVVMR